MKTKTSFNIYYDENDKATALVKSQLLEFQTTLEVDMSQDYGTHRLVYPEPLNELSRQKVKEDIINLISNAGYDFSPTQLEDELNDLEWCKE